MAIERKFVAQNVKEFRIKEFIEQSISRVGLSDVKLKKTPLGDKIIIYASRPGLIVGRGGANIQSLTKKLRVEFNLDNPQIEIDEVKKPDLNADIVAERIINSLERFGSSRTKSIGHRAMQDVMNAGALGVEILISGKIPSMRARRWRFYSGYLKKSGDIAIEGVLTSKKSATLKQGAVGIQVRIMPPTIVLPDHITLTEKPATEVEVTEQEETVTKAEAEVDTKENLEQEAPIQDTASGSESPSEDNGGEQSDAQPVQDNSVGAESTEEKSVSVSEDGSSGTKEEER